MSLDPTRNFFYAELAGGYGPGEQSLTISPGAGDNLPDPETEGAFNLVVFNKAFATPANAYASGQAEIIRVIERSGDSLVVERGVEGTTAITFGSGAVWTVLLAFTKKMFDDINTATAEVADAAPELLEARDQAVGAADVATVAKDEVEEKANYFLGTISVLDEGDDFVELKALNPAELVETTEPLGDIEIGIVEITLS